MSHLAFITPSLSANHGIGDYTRLFAEESVRLGHEVLILSLNEPHSSEYKSEVLQVGDRTIQTHRWGQHIDYALKCREARPLLEAFKPDWVSLQFEFYCYAYRGLLLGLARNLPALLEGYRVQVMMHELWIQLHAAKDVRERLKATVRYLQCRYLFKKIKPLCAHTSAEIYAKRARHLLPEIKLLPIPSNIPVDRGVLGPLPAEISETMTESKLRSGYFLVVLFGRVIPEWDGRAALKQIDEFARRTAKLVRLISIGGCGYNDLYWKQLLEQVPSHWRSIKLGVREPMFISQTLQACDLAVSCTSFSLSRKSGTVAAFFEHGLPVLFSENKPADDEIDISYPNVYRHQLYFADQPLPLDVNITPRVLADEAYSARVTRQFIADLRAAEGRA
jgi:hypothetical protein